MLGQEHPEHYKIMASATNGLRVNLLLIVYISLWTSSASFFLPDFRKYNNNRIFLCSGSNTHSNTCIPAVRVWIEEAEEGFVDEDENLMMGEVCLRAVKAFASHDDHEDHPRAQGDDKEEEILFLGAGALVQRPGSKIYDAWMADCLLDETNLQFEGAVRILDDLFGHHLNTSNAQDVNEIISTFVVQSGVMESEYHSASYMAAISRGFKPLKEYHSRDDFCWNYLELEEEDGDALIFNMRNPEGYFSVDQSYDQTKENIAHLLRRMNQTEPNSIFE